MSVLHRDMSVLHRPVYMLALLFHTHAPSHTHTRVRLCVSAHKDCGKDTETHTHVPTV